MATLNTNTDDLKISKKYPQDKVNEKVEKQTEKIPNLAFVGAAVASMGLSAALTFGFKKSQFGSFVGLWAPTILIFGLYNKMVKVETETLEAIKIH